jgi:hypothetical protein
MAEARSYNASALTLPDEFLDTGVSALDSYTNQAFFWQLFSRTARIGHGQPGTPWNL